MQKNLTFLIIMALGMVVGVFFVLWLVQYSIDVQKVLGLRGRYVELANIVQRGKDKTRRGGTNSDSQSDSDKESASEVFIQDESMWASGNDDTFDAYE